MQNADTYLMGGRIVIRYTHAIICHGKCIAEAISMEIPFSDCRSHRSFFWYPSKLLAC
jgi:hypothetical protein